MIWLGDLSIPPLKFFLVPRVTWLTDAKLRRLEIAYSIGATECARQYNWANPEVTAVSSPNDVPEDGIAVVFSPTMNVPGDLAWHTFSGGRPSCLVLADLDQVSEDDVAVGGDHEIKETIVDAPCDEWVELPSGKKVAEEACDPVEGDVLRVDIGSGDPVATSNWVRPEWFDVTAPTGTQFDQMGLLVSPQEVRPNGYAIILNADGSTTLVGAGPLPHKSHPAFRFGRRMADAHRIGMRVRLGRNFEVDARRLALHRP